MALEDQVDAARRDAILNSIVPEKPQDSDFQKWLEVADDILNFLEHDLRGDTFDQKKNEWIPKTDSEQKAMINDKGIRKIMALTRTVVNKNTFLSRLTEDRILMLTLELNLDIIDMLFLGQSEYEIETKDLTVIEDKIIIFIFNGLCRAEGGGERSFLSTTTKRIESIGEQKKNKFLGIFG